MQRWITAAAAALVLGVLAGDLSAQQTGPTKKQVKQVQKDIKQAIKEQRQVLKQAEKDFKILTNSLARSLKNGSISSTDAFDALFGNPEINMTGALETFQSSILSANQSANSSISSSVQNLYSQLSSDGNSQSSIIPGFGVDQGSITTSGYDRAFDDNKKSDDKKNDALERIKRFFEDENTGNSSLATVGCGPPKLAPLTPGPFGPEGKDAFNPTDRRQGSPRIINLIANQDGKVVIQGFVPPNDPLAGEGGIEVEDVDGNIEFGSFMVDDAGFFTTVVDGLTPGKTVTASIVNVTDGQVFSSAEVTIPGVRPTQTPKK